MYVILLKACEYGRSGDKLLLATPLAQSLIRQKLARPAGWRESLVAKG